jgi:hypothetical protein
MTDPTWLEHTLLNKKADYSSNSRTQSEETRIGGGQEVWKGESSCLEVR